jgi:hypothetical protein
MGVSACGIWIKDIIAAVPRVGMLNQFLYGCIQRSSTFLSTDEYWPKRVDEDCQPGRTGKQQGISALMTTKGSWD